METKDAKKVLKKIRKKINSINSQLIIVGNKNIELHSELEKAYIQLNELYQIFGGLENDK